MSIINVDFVPMRVKASERDVHNFDHEILSDIVDPHSQHEHEKDVDKAKMQLNCLKLFDREVFKHFIHDIAYLLKCKFPGLQIKLQAYRVHVLIIVKIFQIPDSID